jgi:hypothetical protein
VNGGQEDGAEEATEAAKEASLDGPEALTTKQSFFCVIFVSNFSCVTVIL